MLTAEGCRERRMRLWQRLNSSGIDRLALSDPLLEQLYGREATVGALRGLGEALAVRIRTVVAFGSPKEELQRFSKIVVQVIEE